MNPLFDAFVFQFWQRVWFEALQRMPIFETFQRASMTPDPLDAVTARFGVLRRYREFPSDYVAARNVDVWVPPEYEEARGRRPERLWSEFGIHRSAHRSICRSVHSSCSLRGSHADGCRLRIVI